MNRARLFSFFLLISSTIVFIFVGVYAGSARPGQMVDFEMVYVAARTRLQRLDPYKESDFLKSYYADRTFRSEAPMSENFLKGGTRCVYLPTTLLLVAPLAMLPWSSAHVLWMALIASGLSFATISIYDIASRCSRAVAVVFCCLVVANSYVLLAGGNTAGVALGLCVLGVWCFLRHRYEMLGVFLFSLSIALKPHDVVFVLLYFFLAGGTYRRRAWQTIVVTVLISLVSVLWVSRTSPSWFAEQHANLAAITARGEINDPGPAASFGRDPHAVISMQSALSLIQNDARFYNPASYMICGGLLLIWIGATLLSDSAQANAYFGIASVAIISMLPVYHRLYDSKLLLLTVPACALLWAEKSRIRWLALLLNLFVIVLFSDTAALLMTCMTRDWSNKGVLSIPALRPFPTALFVFGIFYLAVYLQRILRRWPRAACIHHPWIGCARRCSEDAGPPGLVRLPNRCVVTYPRD